MFCYHKTMQTIPEQKNTNRTWKSCCCGGIESDRQSSVYIGQMIVVFIILAFSGTMLVLADGNCDKSSAYIGLISFCLGKVLSNVVDGNHV